MAMTSSPAAAARKTKLFMKQAVMLRVCYALTPLLVAGIYFFGWRVLALLAVTVAAAVATEYVTSRQRGQPISMAVFVTAGLLALSLPPETPFWIAAVSVAVGILFGKEVFGGFGRNFANPAIVGRAFAYVCFPHELTAAFQPVYKGFPGGFARWSESVSGLGDYLHGFRVEDAVTTATPMWARRNVGFETPLWDLVTGQIGGAFQAQHDTRVLAAGSIGEVSAVLILLAGAYLIWTRTANWRLTAAMLLGATAANVIFRTLGGAEKVPPLAFTLSSGALMYAAVFMVTDPVSAPKKKTSLWAYGLFIGFMVVLIRWRAQFSGGVAFAILLGNIVGPLMDVGVQAWEDRRARRRAAAGPGDGGREGGGGE
ncbi:MAG: Na(+)-translocating NADH-quinone reductase subunit B [Planctomycetes bacterium ADurb.Bin126]|nr:MAG: Na(+)-translocating NADH-quinone reductase subunit B [Planctomycetes bacterium ADurb.Bin126]HOD81541.1 RnfABCDGE type electron transport complex subunit D [Phycisphaerae bacterium]HQL76387.1 RnfABCDGE type electron transport complex subunit D [Phycisphaerae bacterium]